MKEEGEKRGETEDEKAKKGMRDDGGEEQKIISMWITEMNNVSKTTVCTSPAGQVLAGVHVVVSVTPTLRTLPSSFASPRLRLIFWPPVTKS